MTIPLYTLLISRHTWVECPERRRLSDGHGRLSDGCLTVDRWPAPQPPHHWALTAADWSRRRTHTHAHTRTVLEIFIGQTSPCLCTPEDLDFGCGSIVWLCRPVSEHPISYRNSLTAAAELISSCLRQGWWRCRRATGWIRRTSTSSSENIRKVFTSAQCRTGMK